MEKSAKSRRKADKSGPAPALRDVARAAGVSLAAASLALRGSGKISLPTRERVERAARELGYVPNPLAAAFQSQIRQRKGRKYQATLGWINDYREAGHWKSREVFLAARARAKELGYVLDEVHIDPSGHMDEPEVVTAQFLRVCRARGIHGVLLPSLHRPALAAEVWSGIAVVLVGHFEASLARAKVARVRELIYHNVTSAVFWNTRLALEKMRESGCRRCGLVLTEWDHEVTDREALAQYLEWQRALPAGLRIPPLILPGISTRTRSGFSTWIRRHQPDGLLCSHDEIFDWVNELIPAGRRPRIGHLSVALAGRDCPGIDEREDRIGEAAVDLLTAHLVRNETGVPDFPKAVNIRGEWRG